MFNFVAMGKMNLMFVVFRMMKYKIPPVQCLSHTPFGHSHGRQMILCSCSDVFKSDQRGLVMYEHQERHAVVTAAAA